MNQQEAQDEFLECARYGEYDEIKEIFNNYTISVDYTDEQGTTALHRASVNGHLNIVKFLVENNATSKPNSSGNTPLHWAIQEKKKDVIVYLCKNCKSVDVLAKNEMGKSPLTFGYDTGDKEIITALLEHDSAAELEESNANDDKAEDQFHEHEIAFGDGPIVRVREMGIAPTHLEELSDTSLDTTGATMWAASLVLSRWILEHKSDLENKIIVELGAGCGLPGLTVFKYVAGSKVYITDIDSKTFSNLEHNVQINVDSTENEARKKDLHVSALDWFKEESWPKELVGKVDYIIGSDLVYDKALVAPLLNTTLSLLKSGGCFLYVSAQNSRAGKDQFIEAMKQANFEMEEKESPESYAENPLKNGNQQKFDLHFSEFTEQKFTMYRMTKTV